MKLPGIEERMRQYAKRIQTICEIQNFTDRQKESILKADIFLLNRTERQFRHETVGFRGYRV